MEQDRYYFRVGVFVALSIVGFIVALGWFSGSRSDANYDPYVMYFEGSIEGISVGSPVKLRGIEVGHVTDIAFVARRNERVRLRANIREDAPIHDNLVASVQMKGITGTSVIALEVMRPEDENVIVYYPNKKYPVIKSKPSALDKLFTSMPELMDGLTRMSQQGQKLMSDENIAAIGEAIAAISASAKSVEGMMGGKNREIEKALSEFTRVMVEGKVTLREIKMLVRSLREDPSIILRGAAHKGRELKP